MGSCLMLQDLGSVRSRGLAFARAKLLGLLFILFPSVYPLGLAQAEPVRRAFVVGISNYDDEALRLLGPKNDASLVAKQLSKFAYQQVTLVDEENTTFRKLTDRWATFVNSVRPGDAVVIYFSGHGVAVGNLNYLVARDFRRSDMAASSNASNLKLFSIEKWRSDLVKKRAAVSVWIFDACRDNQIGLETKGLTSIKALSGNLIMYSARAGQESGDAADKNQPSAYTRYFLAALDQLPRQDAVFLARVVQSEVAQAHHDQLPEISSLMSDNWCFNICDPNSIIRLKFDTAGGSYEVASKREFAQSKSIRSTERRQNAVFIGTASQAHLCSSGHRQTNARFQCSVLKDFAEAKFSSYLGQRITPLQPVAIYRRPPIVKDTIKYLCRVGYVDAENGLEVTGVLSFEYRNETYFWATVKDRRETCQKQT
ncbi:hypothetical protein CK489_34935 [Bradyrhizobium sp. UFLA03-84]|nr:hypothetical protein CK489_34935 [Bradyrhizobium sp. UFLA03-84]